ncbi:MAG: nucleotidyltransferase family protein [Candidatus Pacebacteria bacterium]|nr:nucleotidyltransferase family protein [Candidatus Paceibacterota bacterium]
MNFNNIKRYKGVILAGGKGTRLYPITKEIPKPLLLVKRKPIINYLVELFYNQKVSEVAVLINKEFKEEFKWWKKRYFPKKNIIFFEEEKPLGTFGGMFLLKEWIGKKPFFFTNGDELKEINLSKMADFHLKSEACATVALIEVSNPQDYGVAVCKDNIIEEFLEKPENPSSNYINSGFYLFSSDIFNYHKGPKFLMVEKDIFPKLAKEGKLAGFKFSGKWMDCGTFERYSKAIEQWS